MTKEELFSIIPDKPSKEMYSAASKVWDSIAKPIDGLGRFEDIICRIAAIRNTVNPSIVHKCLVIMCADNGVVREGVSQTGSEVTAQVAALMGRRMSSVGTMSVGYPVDIYPIDIGMDISMTIPGVSDRRVRAGTGDIAVTEAMSMDECLQAVKTGIDMVRDLNDKHYDLIATGEMGIGNTTTATAVVCALCGVSPESITGRGAGLDDAGLAHKISVISQALKKQGMYFSSNPDTKEGASYDPSLGMADDRSYALNVLHTLGGLDIAGLSGVYIGGAIYHIPVVLDGLISAAAALCAERMVPGCRDYMIASHTGRERGCETVTERLGLKPVIDADLALGEGTGAVLMMPMLDMAMSLYEHGIRFSDDTGIEHYERYN